MANSNLDIPEEKNIPLLARGGQADDPISVVGEPQKGNKANPELLINHGDGTFDIIPLNKLRGLAHGTGKVSAAEGKRLRLPHFSHGTPEDTSARVSAQGIPTVYVSPDRAFQQTPGVQFLKGNLSRAEFNTLGQRPIAAAFGVHLPDAGTFNLNKIQDILNDRRTFELLEALYRSGSRDFSSEISRARQRAPIGRARETSVIRG